MRQHIFVPVVLMMLTSFTTDVLAQAASDSVAVDTVRNRFIPTGVRIGTDVVSLAKSRYQDNFNGWEVQGDLDFNRYYLVLELGHWGRNFAAETATYANTGDYWRAGIDVNFLTRDPERNVFSLGARYGRSVFTEALTVVREDPDWGQLNENFYHANVNASWIELTTGLKVKVWKIFWLGYTARLKFGLSDVGTPEMLPYDVPGFGRTDKDTTWGFNYYLMVRLPIRKAPPPPPAKKG
jgi:hypothetical protein